MPSIDNDTSADSPRETVVATPDELSSTLIGRMVSSDPRVHMPKPLPNVKRVRMNSQSVKHDLRFQTSSQFVKHDLPFQRPSDHTRP